MVFTIPEVFVDYPNPIFVTHVHMFPFLASHTQSTLYIRWRYATHTLQFCILKFFFVCMKIIYEFSYATRTFLSYAIM